MQIDITALLAACVSILTLVSFFILRSKDAIDEGKRRAELEQVKKDINILFCEIRDGSIKQNQMTADLRVMSEKIDTIKTLLDKLEQYIRSKND